MDVAVKEDSRPVSTPIEGQSDGGMHVRRGIVGGLLAGIVGLGCCVGPAVAALLGIVSAGTAVDVATDLYGDWAWAFRAVGAVVAIAVFATARRRARRCDRRSSRRFAAVLVLTAIATYGLLYGLTTALGGLAGDDQGAQEASGSPQSIGDVVRS